MFSKEAMERPLRTIQAVELVRAKAGTIAHVSANARADEIIAVTVQKDLTLGGVWTLAKTDLARQVSIVEEKGGWSLLFSPNTTIAQVEQRCSEVVRLATKRWEVMQRRMNRN